MGRLMCRAAALLAAGVVALSAPAIASAESALWTVVASPLTATTGTQTTFTLTATNTDPAALLLSDSEIGCIFVDVPSNFTIHDASVTGSNAGGGWHVDDITGNRVKIHTDSGGERLETLEWVRFTITATAWSTGSLTWNSRAYRDQDCGGGGALLAVPPIVVVTGPAVTPTPVPTPVPTPRPTPTPTAELPIPLPSLPLPPLPLPSLGLPTVGATASPSPTPRSEASTPRPTATAVPSSSAQPGSSPPGPNGGAGAPPTTPRSVGGRGSNAAGAATRTLARDVPRVDFDPGELEIDFESVGLLNGTTVWLVPTATFAIPAVLLLLFVALQAAGALAWVPAVRRLSGRDDELA